MAIDLRLIAVPHFEVIENAATHSYYEYVLRELRQPGCLEEELEWAREHNKDAAEQELLASIKEAHELIRYYPEQNTKPYQFHSRILGYSTLNFLLSKHCQSIGEPVLHFFEGKWLTGSFDIPYIDVRDVLLISRLLSATSFQQLWEQYDYEDVKKNAYKPKGPEAFDDLKEEYQELASFYEHAAAFEAYVIIEFS